MWCNSLGHDGPSGAAAEQAAVPADALPPADGVDPVDPWPWPTRPRPAHLALFTHGRLRAARRRSVLGAGGTWAARPSVMAVRAGG
ncbi:hypothetical protein GCM10023238_36760 [Streptomyces heliomycini]